MPTSRPASRHEHPGPSPPERSPIDHPADRPARPTRPAAGDPRIEAKSDAAHFGRFAEARTARWYRRAGYRVLARNWSCREGELDLVVARGGDVTFVEVKARGSDRFGGGVAAVDHRKQRRLRTAALRWLDACDEGFVEVRFDVVEVDRRGRLRRYADCF